MKTRRLLTILFTLLAVCALLAPGSVLADGPGSISISESDLESIIADAAAAPMAGATFSAEKVAAGVLPLDGYPENVYSFLSYTSNSPDPFFPPPQSEFWILESPICFFTYFAVIRHDVTGITIYHVLFPPGGTWPGDAIFTGLHDEPELELVQGDTWRFGLCYEVTPPIWAGEWMYFALVIPSDGDGNILNQEAICPVRIY